MDQICTVNELEQQLKEAGEQLSTIPHSTKDLLLLLDKMEHLLTLVGQAPSPSMQVALVPSMGALIADELLSHSDVNVRVSVASCFCEIARITAPEQPYKDDMMKEIFQLSVMAFGELSHVTGCSYYKAIHILESVAKVKSCLLMLDLECDALIFAMFEQFLGTIRSNHPPAVFSNMEAIMTLVIEEGDEISMDLLSLLLSCVRKENQNLSPVPWKLAEKVLRNCSDILKPYSKAVMELISSDLEDYAEVVTLLCQNAHEHELVVANSVVAKKLKYIDTQSDTTIPKKREREPNTVSSQLDEGYHKHRLKLKNMKKILNQDTTPDTVQHSKEDMARAQSQDKASMGLGLKETKSSKGKPQKSLTNTKGVVKSTTKDHKFKWYGEELVGHRIKVLWPLDKAYYEGAVSSYDSLRKKHTVLYADGDEETLNLRNQSWRMLDDVPPDQVTMLPDTEQGANLPSPATISVKHKKKPPKMKSHSSLMQENPPKCQASASLLKTKPAKKLDIRNADNSTTNAHCNVADHPKDDTVHLLDGGECHTNRIALEPNVYAELENEARPEPAELEPEESERQKLVKNKEFASQT